MLLTELTSFVDANRYKGRREAFGIKGTKNYLRWAFLHDYLIVSYDDEKVAGIAVVYPIATPYVGDEDALNPVHKVPLEDEPNHELCIMDLCALNAKGRTSVTRKFKQRFPYWENQKKWAIRSDKVVEISNKYINLTEQI